MSYLRYLNLLANCVLFICMYPPLSGVRNVASSLDCPLLIDPSVFLNVN